MKVQELLFENKTVSYSKPNFEYEWEEAVRYPTLKKLGKEKWLKLAKSGKAISSARLTGVGNIDLNLSNLEAAKLKRVEKSFKDGRIEMPIIVKIKNRYDLLGGNTRFAYLKSKNIQPQVWLIEV